MATAVITGGTGVIGQALAQDLASDGIEVIILSRNPDQHRNTVPEGIRLVEWRTDAIGDWAASIDGADIVINYAGENLGGNNFLPDRWTADKKNRIRQSRLVASQAVNKAIELASTKPRVLVQSSAIGYYGPRDTEPILESERPGDDFLAQICVDWEAGTEPVEKLGVRRVITRTGILLTSDSGPLPRILVRFQTFTGGPFGSGDQYWSWIHLQDIVRATRYLIDDDSASGPFNLTAPNPVTNREFSRILGRVMQRPSFVPMPSFAMKLMVGEVATIVLDGQRVIPEKLLQAGFEFTFPVLEPAFRDLLHKPAN